MVKKSEVHAYAHILKQLTEKKGWTKEQIYTQGECLEIKEIKKYLGQTKPENTVEINPETYYVIESKNERNKLEQALKEAREDYANKINESNKVKVLFITGIAGNSTEGFIAKSQYLKGNKWETITENKIEVTSLLSQQQIETILNQNSSTIQDVEITEDEFLETAETINEILDDNSIIKDYRARFISAILLAMSDGQDIDVTEKNATVLINTINTRGRVILTKHKKGDFSKFVKIDEPSNADNHAKVRNAIIKTYQELLGLNIRSAMQSGKDVLGKFYEVFLKYGNGAKEMGIVLTPRHITKFAAEVLDVQSNDLVLDPACGTGGFLVSAYDEVRRKTNKPKDFENFKSYGLYGIEEQDNIISLAIVNMIFRGDGKNNMIEGNCFKKWLNAKSADDVVYAEYLNEDKRNRIPPITKVLMNPPFAKQGSEDKEYRFIEHALKQMQDSGVLFAVLPTSVLIEGETKKWRKDVLLKSNRLLSVITFPEELFYPTGVCTVGIFIKKGEPHDFKSHKVYFARCISDGFTKKKGKRLESKNVRNMLEEIKEELKAFIKNPKNDIKNIPEFKKACLLEISDDDDDCELVPEVYLDTKEISFEDLTKGMDTMIREAVSFKIKYHEELLK